MSFGASIGLALLLDHTDPRLRYPEQVTRELGLSILGAVPTIKRSRAGDPDPEEAAQVIESFRTIRMAITNQYDASGSAMLTVSSPGAGDGKSLVCSNSRCRSPRRAIARCSSMATRGAASCTRCSARTAVPGCSICSAAMRRSRPCCAPRRTTVSRSSRAARAATGDRSCCTRRRCRSSSPNLRRRYDVVVVDSPPLGAGVDPFVLAAATQNMLVVLRTGATDRKMAESKLKLLDRLPVRMLGAVLNDIPRARRVQVLLVSVRLHDERG